MLTIDFYESGIGETIIITFPSGGIGVIDAHPSLGGNRPPILDLVKDRQIHFLCLTHPHADHGKDLVSILKDGPKPKVIWHTIPNFKEFIYYSTGFTNFPSSISAFIEKYSREWADCFLDIFATAKEKGVERRQLRADLQPESIDGVEIHFLSPEHNVVTEFAENYGKEIHSAEPEGGDPNLLSAILALKYGGSVVLMGADALKKNWYEGISRFRKAGLPKAVLLKVPHHGAKNAFSTREHRRWPGYLDICSVDPKATAVLFAGDIDHPDPEVYERLKERTTVTCLSNGLRGKQTGPLQTKYVGLPKARSTGPSKICNPHLSFELNDSGALVQVVGGTCEGCDWSQ